MLKQEREIREESLMQILLLSLFLLQSKMFGKIWGTSSLQQKLQKHKQSQIDLQRCGFLLFPLFLTKHTQKEKR